MNKANEITLVNGDKLCLEIDSKQKLETIQTISRYVASLDATLNGTTINEKTEVDSWLDFAQVLLNATSQDAFNQLVALLDSSLNGSQFLVANRLTIADFSVYSSLKSNFIVLRNVFKFIDFILFY